MVPSRAARMVSLLDLASGKTRSGLRVATLAAATIFALTSLTAAPASYGQATTAAGTINGTVTDAKGGAIPGAAVTITNLDTNATKTLATDGSGFYSAGSLVPGSYQVTATAPGFAKTAETFNVQIGNVSNGNLKLTVGSSATEVTVTSDALQVNTTQSTVGGVLNSEQIDSLPIGGRNFLDLAQLEPGVQLEDGQNFDPTKAGYSSVSINGVNGRTARILLDGQDISDETVGTTTFNVPLGSINEFELSRSSLDISNELTSSGSITLSTRTGSNKVHGQAFGLFRDERSGAAAGPGGTNYPFQKNQFGGRLGGPILKDKLFIFGSAERIKQDAFNSVQVAAPFNSFNGGYTSPFRDNQYNGRLDYNGPKGIHLFFRGSYENNLDDATFGYGYSRYGNKDNTPSFAGGADFVTGKFTHELRVSYLKFHNLIADESGSGVPNAAPGVELFISSLITGPNLLAPQQTYQSDKQFRYDGGVTKGNHQIQFGVSFNRILGGGFASFFGFAPELQANFAGGPIGTGGSGLASDPTAYTPSFVVMGNGEGYNTEKASFGAPAGGQGDYRLGLYAGDTWKISPKLTVNAGIRYSRDTGRTDSDLSPIPCSAVSANFAANLPCTSGNLLDSLVPGLGSRVRQPNEDFGPKAGFAYDLKGDGKTVIRGGMGLYYENSIFNNVLFDRPAKLASGLFFGDAFIPSGASSVLFPGGTTVTSINGVAISSLWADAISVSAPYFGALETAYQTATKAAGPAANANFVGNSLSEGPNGDSLYAPNYRVARSIQMNLGIQREVWKGAVFSADYIRNVGEHFQQSLDVNHVGDAQYFNLTAAQNAISATTSGFGCTGGYSTAAIDCAIAAGATITDFASNGLDSGNSFLGGSPFSAIQDANGNPLDVNHGAAFGGMNPLFGRMAFNFPLGRAVYNGLQTNLRQSGRLPFPGIKASSFEVSYTLSRFISTGGADQNFTPGSVDYNHPLAFAGPAGLDRTQQISYGANLGWLASIQTSIIGHYYSAPPTTLTLDTNGDGPGEIYHSDLTGDGTRGDILPGYKSGAFMRSVKPGQIAEVIANYNATSANKLTPAGQTLISQGLFTQAELMAAGATTPTIATPPPANAGNGTLRTFDLVLSRPTKVKWLGDSGSIEPSFSAFNLFNLSNFGSLTGNLAAVQQPDTANGTDTSLNGRAALRNGNGTGVFNQGAARILEYGLKINF